MGVLADAVKDDDRVVDRVADDGQQRRDERGIHADDAAQQHHEGEHDRHVVNEADDRRQTGIEVKAHGDIQQHQDGGEGHALHRVVDEVTASDGAHARDVHIRDGRIGLGDLLLKGGAQLVGVLLVADADLHLGRVVAGLGDLRVGHAARLERRVNVGGFKLTAHLVGHQRAAGEVDAQVHAVAHERHHKRNRHDGKGDAQARLHAILHREFHVDSSPQAT